MLAVSIFVGGALLACAGSISIDNYDNATGRRPGWYGSDISYSWRNVLATIGFLVALGALFALH